MQTVVYVFLRSQCPVKLIALHLRADIIAVCRQVIAGLGDFCCSTLHFFHLRMMLCWYWI